MFYDCAFAFNDIHSFLLDYQKKTMVVPNNKDTKYSHTLFVNSMYQLTQFYFDSKWIHTVANMYGANIPRWKKIGVKDENEIIDTKKIKKIYEVYGHFMTIKKSMDKPDNAELCQSAYLAMDQIFDISSYNEKEKSILLNNDINDVFLNVGKIACLKEDEIIGLQYKWLKI